ncbi:MAG: hypothetical protein QOD25_38, partial [Alphaproteobacteria bacterium]|nr:hypothetical protein [Alphaproteobacteria bacterium]
MEPPAPRATAGAAVRSGFHFRKRRARSPPIHREISAAMQKAVRKDKLVAG